MRNRGSCLIVFGGPGFHVTRPKLRFCGVIAPLASKVQNSALSIRMKGEELTRKDGPPHEASWPSEHLGISPYDR